MDRKQFYGKLYYSTATKNIKQIMMMIIKLKIVIMIILMMKMTNLYFSADDVVAWTNQSSKTTSVARCVFVFVFLLVFMFTLHHHEHRGEHKKSKDLIKKRISREKEANEQSKFLPIEIIINWRKFYSVSRLCTSIYDDRLNICHIELYFLIERIIIIIITIYIIVIIIIIFIINLVLIIIIITINIIQSSSSSSSYFSLI